jgi:hypothetical protein
VDVRIAEEFSEHVFYQCTAHLRDIYKDLDKVADIQKKRLKWIGHVVRWIREGELRKYLRINQREVEEGFTGDEGKKMATEGSR